MLFNFDVSSDSKIRAKSYTGVINEEITKKRKKRSLGLGKTPRKIRGTENCKNIRQRNPPTQKKPTHQPPRLNKNSCRIYDVCIYIFDTIDKKVQHLDMITGVRRKICCIRRFSHRRLQNPNLQFSGLVNSR